jgi:hypothetical protein
MLAAESRVRLGSHHDDLPERCRDFDTGQRRGAEGKPGGHAANPAEAAPGAVDTNPARSLDAPNVLRGSSARPQRHALPPANPRLKGYQQILNTITQKLQAKSFPLQEGTPHLDHSAQAAL